ncbi:MAG: alpha/beta fold hydrolase [bacterium]
MHTEAIQFETEDGVTIHGTWRNNSAKAPWTALLLHMMPSDRTSWEEFSQELAQKNISSLAIDLRGHGESVHQGSLTLKYQAFTDQQHQESFRDVLGAHQWLFGHDVPEEKIIPIGASFGATLALQDLAVHPQLHFGVVLSPGMNYRSVDADPLVRKLLSHQSLLLVASKADTESAAAAIELDRIAQMPHELFLQDGSAHGTDMLTQEDFLGERIVNWLEENIFTDRNNG